MEVQEDKLTLPNIRKLFIPDQGYLICDADLVGADAQVVAWEANDLRLMQAFRDGLDVHSENATDLWEARFTGLSLDDPERDKIRNNTKRAVHATNYIGSAKAVAANCGWLVIEAERFQRRWFDLHPGIKAWHDEVRLSLATTRSVSNRFGYRIIYYDRIDQCLPKAIAWIPQSTVAEVCFRGALQVEEKLSWLQLLLQVHDSLVFQIPANRNADRALIGDALRVTVPYPDPLTIPWGLAVSNTSWGDVKKVQWN